MIEIRFSLLCLLFGCLLLLARHMVIFATAQLSCFVHRPMNASVAIFGAPVLFYHTAVRSGLQQAKLC